MRAFTSSRTRPRFLPSGSAVSAARARTPAATLAAAAGTTEGKAALSWPAWYTAGAAVPAVEAVSGLPQWAILALVVSVAAVVLAVVLTHRQDLPA